MRDNILEYITSIKETSDSITDMDIYRYVVKLKLSQNCISAGKLFFGIISSICPLRPSLEHLLIRIAIRPIFYAGIEDAKQLLEWTDSFCNYIKESKNNQVEYLFTDESLVWLEKIFPLKKDIIEKCFYELKAVCNIYELLFKLKENKEKGIVTLHSVFNEKEYNTEFKSYEEFQKFIFKELSEFINITYYESIENLYLLVDEEIEEFRIVFWRN